MNIKLTIDFILKFQTHGMSSNNHLSWIFGLRAWETKSVNAFFWWIFIQQKQRMSLKREYHYDFNIKVLTVLSFGLCSSLKRYL
jgi:hypothetical protein